MKNSRDDIHHTVKKHEPHKKWKRHDYGKNPAIRRAESEMTSADPADIARYETDRDLSKPIEQLVWDVQTTHRKWAAKYKRTDQNDEGKKEDDGQTSPEYVRLGIELVLEALTRSTAMNGRVARSNTRLTWAIIILMSVQVIVAVCLARCSAPPAADNSRLSTPAEQTAPPAVDSAGEDRRNGNAE